MSGIKIDVTQKQVKAENGHTRMGYGLIAYRAEKPEILFEIDDLSSNEKEVIALAELITDNGISLERFEKILDEQLQQ